MAQNCSKCGATQEDGTKFCSYCGHEFSATQQPASAPYDPYSTPPPSYRAATAPQPSVPAYSDTEERRKGNVGGFIMIATIIFSILFVIRAFGASGTFVAWENYMQDLVAFGHPLDYDTLIAQANMLLPNLVLVGAVTIVLLLLFAFTMLMRGAQDSAKKTKFANIIMPLSIVLLVSSCALLITEFILCGSYFSVLMHFDLLTLESEELANVIAPHSEILAALMGSIILDVALIAVSIPMMVTGIKLKNHV